MDLTFSRKKAFEEIGKKNMPMQLVAQTLLRNQKIQQIERLQREVAELDVVILYIQERVKTDK